MSFPGYPPPQGGGNQGYPPPQGGNQGYPPPPQGYGGQGYPPPPQGYDQGYPHGGQQGYGGHQGYPAPAHGYGGGHSSSGSGERWVLEAPDGTQIELSEQEALSAGGEGATYEKQIPTNDTRGMPDGAQDRGIGKILMGAAAAGLAFYLMRGVIKKVSGHGKPGKKDKKDKKDKKGKKDKKDKKKKRSHSSSSSGSSSS